MRAVFRLAQSGMAMDERAWQRHASPWTMCSRMTVLPLLGLALWSRVWLDWWVLAPIGLCAIWIWLNPRLFPPPRRTDNWASEGTFGERILMEDESVAGHHRRAVAWLTTASLIALAILAWGLVALNPWIALWGLTVTMGSKLWTFDRMVWLYRERRVRPGSPA